MQVDTQDLLLITEYVVEFGQVTTQDFATVFVQRSVLHVLVQDLMPVVVSSVNIPNTLQSVAVTHIRPICG